MDAILIDSRYLLYEVNPGEGFNLRRDVYLRVANLVSIITMMSCSYKSFTSEEHCVSFSHYKYVMLIIFQVKFLNEEPGQQWVLVLPAWTRMYHWRNHRTQLQEPWKKFFDLGSLQRHIPVMEVTDWMKGVYLIVMLCLCCYQQLVMAQK